MPPKYTPTPEDYIPNGLCECGCGQPTTIVKGTDRKAGKFAGYPHRFLKGHHNRARPSDRPQTGICGCGCGLPTSRIKESSRKADRVAGEFYIYRRGHSPKRFISGTARHNFKGGRIIASNGYVQILKRGHPLASKQGYVPEHRLVMEEHLGRYLTHAESVHHINGIKDDNRLENLQLRKRYHGYGQAFQCANCGSHNIIPVDLD